MTKYLNYKGFYGDEEAKIVPKDNKNNFKIIKSLPHHPSRSMNLPSGGWLPQPIFQGMCGGFTCKGLLTIKYYLIIR